MGDRAQVVIRDGRENVPDILLYTHWAGHRLPETVAEALASEPGRARAADTEYLARIIFETMLQGATDPETGYGIGTLPHGDVYRFVVVRPSNRQVALVTGAMSNGHPVQDADAPSWSFGDYVDDRPGWPERHE